MDAAAEETIDVREQSLTEVRPGPARLPRQQPGTAAGGRGRLASFLVPLLVSTALGLWGISRHDTMWRDESVTYQVAHRSVFDLVGLLDSADAVHGLYYLLMHALFGVWEGGLLTLRIPSVLATAVSAGCVGLVACRLAGVRAGLLSGVVFCVLPEVQMYAQEGRSYALVCAFVAFATYVLARALTGASRPLWAVYGAALLLACWLHEFAVLALLGHGAAVAHASVSRAVRRAWTAAAAVVVAAVAPLAVFSMGQSAQVSWIGSPKPGEWLEIAAVAVLALLCARRLSKHRAPALPHGPLLRRLALPLALAPTAALLLASLHEPVYVDRYVLYVNVGLALLVGAAADAVLADPRTSFPPRTRVGRRIALSTLIGGLVLALLPVTLQMRTPDSRKDDLAAIAEAVERVSGRGDGLVFTPARRREWKLSYAESYDGLADLALKRSPEASGTLQGEEHSAPEIRRRMLSATRIVVLSDPPDQPEDAVGQELTKREVLRHHFERCARTRVKGAQVTLYARPGACGPPS
ncbi:glycosyltransferase family 39 protein [Streptomyces sp. MUM 178J]|uniref:glycosyltransferase family 39 protein n=1 Tax=Streptomyces sp. MUM 178J TaxID=2791991 RepID=UPI001F035760|nr:glycosyltransferase family 39 protein [Streptomyces sp. MUM 178J]WRQ80495.1 glycosyltransferase family 39 protein [Streptomyces sp. MUM 178J]